jgi:hypothetical protein
MENSTPAFISSLQESLSYSYDLKPVFLSYLTKFYIWFPLLLLSYIVYTRYFTGLSHIPGPFIASISNFWKISAAWHEEMPQRNIALHRKYGSLVRIGPNMISVDDPSALSTIYGFKPIYLKVRQRLQIPERRTNSNRPPSTPSSKPSTTANSSQTSSPRAPSSTTRTSNAPPSQPTQ